jgi:hypothetical protein
MTSPVTAHGWNDLARQHNAQEVVLSQLRLIKLAAATSSKQAAVTITIANPAVVTWNAHDFVNDEPFWLSTDGALPTGLSPSTIYYVRNKTANTFELSAAKGGASIGTAGAQSGTHTGHGPFDPTDTDYDQVTGGTKSNVTISIASPGKVIWNGHGRAANHPITLRTTGALPTGLTINTVYYVKNPTTNDFELSATPGGASIITSGAQSGIHTAWAAGSHEVHGNGWSPFGEPLVNVGAAVKSVNDAKTSADQTSVLASGGSVSARFMAIINFALMKVMIFYDLGQEETAGETTDFKATFNLGGGADLNAFLITTNPQRS